MIQFIYDSDKELFQNAMTFAQKQVKRLIETYPGPHRAQFTFERSLVWERLRTKLDQRESSQGPGVAAPRLAS